jgi:hypothetical protein
VLNQFASYPFAEALNNRGCCLDTRAFRALLSFHDLNKVPPEGPEAANMRKESQHDRSGEVIDKFRALLPVSDAQHRLVKGIVAAQILGPLVKAVLPNQVPVKHRLELGLALRDNWNSHSYRKGCELFLEHAKNSEVSPTNKQILIDDTVERVIRGARQFGVSATEFLYLCTIYYQCDTASYTADAASASQRGIVSLDFLYQLDPKSKHPSDALFLFDQEQGRLKFREPYETIHRQIQDKVSKLDQSSSWGAFTFGAPRC